MIGQTIAACVALCGVLVGLAPAQAEPIAFVRYEHAGDVRHGVLDGQSIAELHGGLFPLSAKTGRQVPLADVRLLPPTNAGKVFAVGMNFASHFASSSRRPPPVFLKLPSSLIGHGRQITFPPDATNVHFEGELVLVIGKRAKNIPEAEASRYIFGVTAGNDLTERTWQRRDLQWLRAKASDGFGPVGPAVVSGLDYNQMVLTTRLNGRIVQRESTRNMIHKPDKVVSYLSRYFTLEPGDLIFMGTPGRTRALKDKDVVSVTIDGIGTLTNTIAR